jgi:hypothetical protein
MMHGQKTIKDKNGSLKHIQCLKPKYDELNTTRRRMGLNGRTKKYVM